MRWSLIFLALFGFCATAGPAKFSMGAGLESRVDHDVNSDYDEAQSMGLVFASFAIHPWSTLLEVDNYQTTSAEGNYSIHTSEFSTMLWGRFEPWRWWIVSPYVGVGLGWSFSNVVSQFGSANDNRWTDGGAMVGGALGLMADFWKHWKVEGEMRLVRMEFNQRPVPSYVLRTGYTF